MLVIKAGMSQQTILSGKVRAFVCGILYLVMEFSDGFYL